MKRTVLAALCLSTLVACGDDEKDITVSCHRDADDECIAISGSEAAINEANYTRSACEQGGGTFGSGCPSASRVGRCTSNDAPAFNVVFHYYSPTYTAEAVEVFCTEGGGTFTPN